MYCSTCLYCNNTQKHTVTGQGSANTFTLEENNISTWISPLVPNLFDMCPLKTKKLLYVTLSM